MRAGASGVARVGYGSAAAVATAGVVRGTARRARSPSPAAWVAQPGGKGTRPCPGPARRERRRYAGPGHRGRDAGEGEEPYGGIVNPCHVLTSEPVPGARCRRPLPGPGIGAAPCFCRTHLDLGVLHTALPQYGNFYALLMPGDDTNGAWPRSCPGKAEAHSAREDHGRNPDRRPAP